MSVVTQEYACIVSAPGFSLGVVCDEVALARIDFLPACRACEPSNPLAARATEQLRGWLADASQTFDLPLKAQGTLFQRRVWAEISHIPTGMTCTYGELAKKLQSAPRAVGQACGANPLPVLVPCHRVVAAGGGLGGFNRQRAGFLLEVKRWLLAHERDA